MKKLDVYERKTVLLGIVLGLINLAEYLLIYIPKNSLSYYHLFYVVPIIILFVYLSLSLENYLAVYYAKTVESTTLSNSAIFTKVISYLVIIALVIWSFFVTYLFGFYAIMVLEYVMLSLVYAMDDAYNSLDHY